MTFLTRLALRRSSVTMLVIALVLAGGVYAYNTLERELFPDIEFPNITITAYYPTADPETIAREVTEPIEDAIANVQGLNEIQSSSQQNVATVLATFDFGEDMEDAKRTIESNVNGLELPSGVEFTSVSRINNDTFPVMQLSAAGDRDIVSLQRILDDSVIPRIESIDGVFDVYVLGRAEERVIVTVDADKLEDLGLSMLQVGDAISGNNISFPAGSITDNEISYAIRAAKELGSLQDIRDLVIGYEQVMLPTDPPALAGVRDFQGQRAVLISDVATVELGTSEARGISRAQGKPSLNILIVKEPDANTLDVTVAVQEQIAALDIPPDIELLEVTNNGPIVEESLSGLLREGTLGFVFAISAVFLFLINFRPTILRGLGNTLRPTVIIGISIPLSVLGGILIMSLTGISLNFMSLAGLAIAVGRVVDDSIVVLENIYRHIQRGEDNLSAAIDGTREVGAAIVSSTLTTVMVFVPLAFIRGLVGEFFTPFAASVSFALVASTFVALTAVPVLSAALLRRGDLPDVDSNNEIGQETWMQRLYAPVLALSLRFKWLALLVAVTITLSSMVLLTRIPITFFPAGAPDYLTMDIQLEPGSAVGRTFEYVYEVESILDTFVAEGHLTLYQVSIGQSAAEFNQGIAAENLHIAGFVMRVAEDAPRDIAARVRQRLPADDGEVTYLLTEITDGPPSDALEIRVVGSSYVDIAAVARELEQELAQIGDIVNLNSDVTAARDEVSVRVDSGKAAQFGLSTLSVAQQVNQFIVGRKVTEMDLEDVHLDVVVRGRPEDVDNIEKLKDLNIQGPLGSVKLGSVSEIGIEQAPIAVTRFDRERSALITGSITAVDTQAVGARVQAVIDGLELPPGVTVRSGGIFQQIDEGFQDVFVAMAVGIVLVYLVMVASLGSLRDPFIIVLSLPFAIVGALLALAITDRTLSLSAMMGFLLLVGIVVTNAIVLITFVEQLRERGMSVHEALTLGGRVRIRPILMTAFTTTFALLPLALSGDDGGGIIGAELATVVIGGLISSTFLTLIVVPVVYTLMHSTIPGIPGAVMSLARRRRPAGGSPGV